MLIRLADPRDAPRLASLLWRFAGHGDAAGPDDLVAELERWWVGHRNTHMAFLATQPDGSPAGMAWLALTARVPRPGNMTRMCGDVQSVYVLPDHRGAGIGSALVGAVLQYADDARLEHVTVHANQGALSLYERAGFAPDGELLMRSRPSSRQPRIGRLGR